MKNVYGLSSRLVLSTLLGLSLAACLSLSPANAQDKMKKDSKMSKDKMMADDHMMGDYKMMHDEDDVLPAPPMYPMASPGSLNLYHWTDYTRKHIASGSAMDSKMDKMKMKEEKMMSGDHKMMMHEEDILPTAMSYPNASAGSLNLYHWTDYTRKHIASGSAMDSKMDKMKMKEEKMMSGDHKMMMHEEDILPATPSYPMASPGSLNLYHWTDYTHKHMDTGSAMDKKMDKMHDKMMKDTMKK